MHGVSAGCPQKPEQGVADLLRLQLQMAESRHVGAGIQIQFSARAAMLVTTLPSSSLLLWYL